MKYSFDFLKKSFENIKTILNTQALLRQMVGQIWLMGYTLWTPGLKSRTMGGFF